MKIYLIRGDTIDGEPSGYQNVLAVHTDEVKAEEHLGWFKTDPYQKKRYWALWIDEWETE